MSRRKFKRINRGIRNYQLDNRIIVLLRKYDFTLECYAHFCKDTELRSGDLVTRAGNHLYHRSCFNEMRL